MKNKTMIGYLMIILLLFLGSTLFYSNEVSAEKTILVQYYFDYDTGVTVHRPEAFQCDVGQKLKCEAPSAAESDDKANLADFYFPPSKIMKMHSGRNEVSFIYIKKEPQRLEYDFWRYGEDWSSILADIQQKILNDPQNLELNTNYYRFVKERYFAVENVPVNLWQQTKFLNVNGTYEAEAEQYRPLAFVNNFNNGLGNFNCINEVLVHSYNGFGSTNNFGLEIPLGGNLRTRVASALGVSEQELSNQLVIVIQNPLNIGQGKKEGQPRDEKDKQVLLRPQWAYARKYYTSYEKSTVRCSAVVYQPQEALQKPLNHRQEGVSLHPDGRGVMAISPHNLPLGFTNSQILAGENRAVLSNVEFVAHNLAREKKTTLNFVFNYKHYTKLLRLIGRGQSFSSVISEQVKLHRVSDQVATLLDLLVQ